MVDSIGSSMSYNDLFRIDKDRKSETVKTETETPVSDRDALKQQILEGSDNTRLTQTLRSRFERYESQVSQYEDQYNRYSAEEQGYNNISDSISNISDYQKQYNSEDISEEDKAALQSKVNEELDNIRNIYENTQYDDKTILRKDRNVEKLLDDGFSLSEPDNDTLENAVSEIDLRKEDTSSRKELAENSLDRVNEKYDEALKGAQVVTGSYNPQQATDNIRFELLKNIGVRNISDYYTLNSSSIFNLLGE